MWVIVAAAAAVSLLSVAQVLQPAGVALAVPTSTQLAPPPPAAPPAPPVADGTGDNAVPDDDSSADDPDSDDDCWAAAQ